MEHPSVRARIKAEQQAAARFRDVKEIKTAEHNHIWSNIAERSATRSQIKRVAAHLKNQDEKTLNERRTRLFDMLQQEDAEYRVEMESLQHLENDSAARQRRLVARALQNRELKEEKRQAEAHDRYRQQFLSANHDIRALKSDLFNKHVHEEVAKQQQLAQETARRRAEEEAEWHRSWERERRRAEEADTAAMRQRSEFNTLTAKALATQMDIRRTQTMMEERAKDEENAMFKEKLAQDEAAARQRAADHLRQRKAEQQRLNELNHQARSAQRDAAEREKQREREQAQRYQEADVRAQSDALAARRQYAEDIAGHAEQVRRTREHERQREREREEIALADQRRIEAQYDAQQEAMQRAREALARDAYSGVAQQLEVRDRIRRAELAAKAVERQAVDREAVRHSLMDAMEEEQRREHEERQRQTLQKQVQLNRARRDIQESRVVYEREAAAKAEAQYQAYLAHEKKALLAEWSDQPQLALRSPTSMARTQIAREREGSAREVATRTQPAPPARLQPVSVPPRATSATVREGLRQAPGVW